MGCGVGVGETGCAVGGCVGATGCAVGGCIGAGVGLHLKTQTSVQVQPDGSGDGQLLHTNCRCFEGVVQIAGGGVHCFPLGQSGVGGLVNVSYRAGHGDGDGQGFLGH